MEFDNLLFSLISFGTGPLAHKTKSIRVLRTTQESSDDDEKPKAWLSIDIRLWLKDGSWTPTGIRLKINELKKLYDLLSDKDAVRSFTNNSYYRRTVHLLDDEDDTQTSNTFAVLLEKEKISGIMLNKSEISRLLKIIPPVIYFVENFDLDGDVCKELLENCIVYCLHLAAQSNMKKNCLGCNQKSKNNEIEILSPVDHSCTSIIRSDIDNSKWFDDLFTDSSLDKEAQSLFVKVMLFFEKSRTTAIDNILDYFSEIKKDDYLREKVRTVLKGVKSDCFELIHGIFSENLLKDVPHPASLSPQKRRRTA